LLGVVGGVSLKNFQQKSKPLPALHRRG